MWCSIYVIVRVCVRDNYMYIGVGLSALLGLTDRAMRRPSKRGPGKGLAPRFLLYHGDLNKLTTICPEELRVEQIFILLCKDKVYVTMWTW